MLKFLRKYNTLILVVGGSLLMVVFLVPQAIEQIGRNPANIPYAEIEGETVTQQDFLDVQREWQMINQIVPLVVGVLQIESVDHYMLLTHEAEKYGLVGGASDGASSVGFFAEYTAQATVNERMRMMPWSIQTNEQYFAAIESQAETARANILARLEQQTSTGRSEMAYFRALAKLRGVTRLLQTYTELAGLSIPETQLAAAEIFDRVTADVGIVPANAFRPEPASLDIEAVRAHFETYRTVASGEGEFGFGYLLPEAVKYEWLRVNSSAITETIEPEPADLLEYFRRNEGRYPGQQFEAARSRVRADYVNSIARQRIESITKEIQRERLRASQSLPRDSQVERYRVVPEDWIGPELETYATVAREASGLTGQAAEDLVTITPVSEEFLDFRSIATSEIGSTRYEFTQSEILTLPQLLFSAKEFGGDERLDFQRGLLFGPVVNPRSGGLRDLIFVRITDVRQEGPAGSVEAVEEKVREDLATLRGYEELSERAETFREAFADGGVTWFFEMEFSNSNQAKTYLDAVIGNDTVQTNLGDPLPDLAASALPSGVIEHARTLDPTQPLDGVAADARTTSVLMPERLSLGLVTIKAFRPTTVDRLREGMVQIERRLKDEGRALSTQAPYSFGSLAERLGFERLDREEEEF